MKRFSGGNGVLVLVIALLLAALTFVVSFLAVGSEPFANFFGFITTPVRNAGAAVANWVNDRVDARYQEEALREEVERLRRELSRMEEKAREGEAASVENENLRALLGLREKRRDFEFESATVTAQGQSNRASTFTISKGTQHGVALRQCVVDAYGNLVGVISEVGLNWATVLTLVDTDMEMGGMVSRTDAAAILEGDFVLMSQNRLKLTYLPQDAELTAGDEVVTSGKGGVYPAGLVVGTVETVHGDPSGMTRYAVIVPKTDLSALKQVFIIKSFDIVE